MGVREGGKEAGAEHGRWYTHTEREVSALRLGSPRSLGANFLTESTCQAAWLIDAKAEQRSEATKGKVEPRNGLVQTRLLPSIAVNTNNGMAWFASDLEATLPACPRVSEATLVCKLALAMKLWWGREARFKVGATGASHWRGEEVLAQPLAPTQLVVPGVSGQEKATIGCEAARSLPRSSQRPRLKRLQNLPDKTLRPP